MDKENPRDKVGGFQLTSGVVRGRLRDANQLRLEKMISVHRNKSTRLRFAASAGGRGLSDDGWESELAPHHNRPEARAANGILKKSSLVAREFTVNNGASRGGAVS